MKPDFPGLDYLLPWIAQTAAPAAPQGSPLSMFLPIMVIGVLFYFLMLRPQSQERKKLEEVLSKVARGDAVITTGGIHGVVESVDKEKATVAITVAPKVVLTISRGSIATVTPKKNKSAEKETDAEKG